MQQKRDELAVLLAYLFAMDIREHPMPVHRQQQLLQTVRQLLIPEPEGGTSGQEQDD